MPLLERVGRNVRLTAAAQTLVAHTDALLARVEEAEADLEATAEQITGTVPRGGDPVRRPVPARARAAAARPRHPALRVEVIDAEPETSMPSLALGTLDLALGDQYPFLPRPPDTRLELEPLLEEPFHIVLPRITRWRRAASRCRSPRCATSRGRSASTTAHYARADDPRLPRARRLRARRPPPLQRPADAARAGRQRSGGDAAARPGRRRPRAVGRHARHRRGAARPAPCSARSAAAARAGRRSLRCEQPCGIQRLAFGRQPRTHPEPSRRRRGPEPAAELGGQLRDAPRARRAAAVVRRPGRPARPACTRSPRSPRSPSARGERVAHHAVGAAIDDVGTRRGSPRAIEDDRHGGHQCLDLLQAGQPGRGFYGPSLRDLMAAVTTLDSERWPALLLVDDDAPIRRMLERTLSAEGYDVEPRRRRRRGAGRGRALGARTRSCST